MLAGFEVEVGPGEPFLSVPWEGEGECERFLDLRAHPDLIDILPEAAEASLRDALVALNSESSRFFTAKCDLWREVALSGEEQGFFPHACCKRSSYIDVIFFDPLRRASFADAEGQMRNWVQHLRTIASDNASADFVLRACEIEGDRGFYWSVYVNGFGADEEDAQRHWREALDLVVRTMVAGPCPEQ